MEIKRIYFDGNARYPYLELEDGSKRIPSIRNGNFIGWLSQEEFDLIKEEFDWRNGQKKSWFKKLFNL